MRVLAVITLSLFAVLKLNLRYNRGVCGDWIILIGFACETFIFFSTEKNVGCNNNILFVVHRIRNKNSVRHSLRVQ